MFIKELNESEHVYRLDADLIMSLDDYTNHYREYSESEDYWQDELKGLAKNGFLKGDKVIFPKGTDFIWINPDTEIMFYLLINGEGENFMNNHYLMNDELPELVGGINPLD